MLRSVGSCSLFVSGRIRVPVSGSGVCGVFVSFSGSGSLVGVTGRSSFRFDWVRLVGRVPLATWSGGAPLVGAGEISVFLALFPVVLLIPLVGVRSSKTELGIGVRFLLLVRAGIVADFLLLLLFFLSVQFFVSFRKLVFAVPVIPVLNLV